LPVINLICFTLIGQPLRTHNLHNATGAYGKNHTSGVQLTSKL